MALKNNMYNFNSDHMQWFTFGTLHELWLTDSFTDQINVHQGVYNTKRENHKHASFLFFYHAQNCYR